jgi:hypothetical protein
MNMMLTSLCKGGEHLTGRSTVVGVSSIPPRRTAAKEHLDVGERKRSGGEGVRITRSEGQR